MAGLGGLGLACMFAGGAGVGIEGPLAPTAPTLSGLPDLSTPTGTGVTINCAGYAIGSDLLWSMTGPAWLSINPSTGQITGTSPGSAEAGAATVTVSNGGGSASDSFAVTVTAVAGGGDIAPFVVSGTMLTAGDSLTLTASAPMSTVAASVNGEAQSVAGTGATRTIGPLSPGLLTIVAEGADGSETIKAWVSNTGATARPLSDKWAFIGASMTADLEYNLPWCIAQNGGVSDHKYLLRSASGVEDLWVGDGVDTGGNANADPVSGIPSMKTALAVGDRGVFVVSDLSAGDYDFTTWDYAYRWDELACRNGVADRYFYMIHHSEMPGEVKTDAELAALGMTYSSHAAFHAFWYPGALINMARKQEWFDYYNANRVPGTKPIWMIPVFQIFVAIHEAIEAGTAHPEITSIGQMFLRANRTDAHMRDVGKYVMALAHFATIWRRKPTGLRFSGMYSATTDFAYSDACSDWLIDVVWSVITSRTDCGLADDWSYPAIAAAATLAEKVTVGVTPPGATEVSAAGGAPVDVMSLPGVLTVDGGSVVLSSDNGVVSAALDVLGLGSGADRLRAWRVEEVGSTALTWTMPPEAQVGGTVVVVCVVGSYTTSPFYLPASGTSPNPERKAYWQSSQTTIGTRNGYTLGNAATDRRSYVMVKKTIASAADLGTSIGVSATGAFYVTLVIAGAATVTPAFNPQVSDGTTIVNQPSITLPALPGAQDGDIVFAVMGGRPASNFGLSSVNTRKQWWFKPRRMATTPNAADLTAVQKSPVLFQFGFEYPEGPMPAEDCSAMGRKLWSCEGIRLLIHPT